MMALLTGLFAGALHVLAGPDHLVALAPIAADKPRRALSLGLRWGLGHGLGVVTLGLLAIFAKDFIDTAWLSARSELMVGFVLIGVGLWAARRASGLVVHAHGHDHEGDTHEHLHVHVGGPSYADHRAHLGHQHAAFMVGMLHGAAGTGHLLGVLPSLALPPFEATLYLGAYLLAAVVAMGLCALAMGRLVGGRSLAALRRVMFASSASAIALGVVWVAQAWNF